MHFRWTIFVLLLPILGCSNSSSPPTANTTDGLPRVRLVLNWYPEAEHGGFYAAQQHGYFRDAGIEVEILGGGPGSPVVQEVVTGRVEFGITNADQILLARDQGADVLALMAPLQNSPRCIMVREDSGIKSFSDLHDCTLAMSDGKPFAMFLKHSLPLTKVEFVPSPGGNVAEFLLDKKMTQQAYVFSEPFVVKQQGGAARTLMVSELGFNPYASVLFTTGNRAKSDSKIVSALVSASIKGWEKYLADPDATNALIHSKNPEMGLDILEFGAKAMQPLCRPDDEVPVGTMTAERWASLVEQMSEIGAISAEVTPSDCYTLDFLTE